MYTVYFAAEMESVAFDKEEVQDIDSVSDWKIAKMKCRLMLQKMRDNNVPFI